MSLVSSILGVGASFIGQRARHKQQTRNIREQLAADRSLANEKYAHDLRMWQLQNEYNTPAAQMARLRDAGLNPHLVYGSGSVTGNTAGQMPQYSQVRSNFSGREPIIDPIGMLHQFQDMRMKNAQIDNVQLQNDNQRIENHYADLFFRGRGLGSITKFDRDNLRRGIEYGDRKLFDTQGKLYEVMGTPGAKRFHSELQRTQAQTKGYVVGEQLKQIERKWLEAMKMKGIGAGLALPLLRLILGR